MLDDHSFQYLDVKLGAALLAKKVAFGCTNTTWSASQNVDDEIMHNRLSNVCAFYFLCKLRPTTIRAFLELMRG